MPKNSRRESRPLKRRGPQRLPRLRVTIFTEGKNTEPHYFRQFANNHGNTLVVIECVGGAGVPATLVDKAEAKAKALRRTKDFFARSDQVWAIFDRDEHPLVAESIDRAKRLGVRVGFSNPCFEVWLLLHYGEFDAPDDRHEVQRKLRDFDGSFDPNGSKLVDYEALKDGYEGAVSRAERLRMRRLEEGDEFGPAYTNVDQLTGTIVANGKSKRQG